MNDIKKLREMTGAGLADCKKALAESDDMDGAVAYLRKKGQAVAAKRSDREASEGCVLVKAEAGFGAIIALKCETDFVANNADFIALTKSILDAAVAARCKTLDEVKALPMGEVPLPMLSLLAVVSLARRWNSTAIAPSRVRTSLPTTT